MLTATCEMISAVTGAQHVAGEPQTVGNDVSIDSREIQPGAIFIALPGERTDGHDHVLAAIDAGARIIVMSREMGEVPGLQERTERDGICVLTTPSTSEALAQLAAWHRLRLHAHVVGITGSTGKTTTKDFLNAVLRPRFRVVATAGNRNNDLGVPLTLLRAGADTDVLVVEMGMRGLGQIAFLADIARPEIGLVTNVGTSHIELLGTQDAVAAAKGELVRAIDADGAVFLNADDGYSETLALDSVAPVTMYGTGERANVRAVDIVLDDQSRASFTIIADSSHAQVHLPVPGRHNVYNALAATSVGLRLGLPLAEIADSLSRAEVTSMRMQMFTTPDDVTVINDAYNANPTSMRAAVETLAGMRATGKRVAVLGDMAELGSLSELAHFQIGENVARLGIDRLIAVGPRATRIADGARAEGMPTESVWTMKDLESAATIIGETVSSGDVVLVKASRVMGLEKLVEGIVTPGAC